MKELKTEILIVGAGTGGYSAALTALQMGRRVIMTEPTAWIGGQLTQQAVPPDENRWIETCGGTRRYRSFREQVRDYYRRHYPLTQAARERWNLNPGNGRVSRLCHEFKVGLAVLEAGLQAYQASGQLRLYLFCEPFEAYMQGDRILGLGFVNTQSGARFHVSADYIVDASELGDVLPLAQVEYRIGFESKAMTGEPSARERYEPLNQQAVSVCFAVDYLEGEDHTIERPEMYSFFRDTIPVMDTPWGGPFLAWEATHPVTLKRETRTFVPHCDGTHAGNDRDLWLFRRIADRNNFIPGTYASDIVLVNWPQLDYVYGPIVEGTAEENARHLYAARQQALSLLYWMQTEAPRHDGKSGMGYRGLRLRGDIVGDTPDGLAMHPYIRESRRIVAEFTVLEQHVARSIRRTHGAEQFEDAVGIGHYNIDLHPSTGGNNYIDVPSAPFQIPLGTLLPQRVENLLAGSKNLGVTHITNGCYRLHPVEWNVGEAAGALAAWCLIHGLRPKQVRNTKTRLAEFQNELLAQGVTIAWPRIF